ncbi:MAG: Zn-dependent hydrolase [Hyphomicrobiaceae bacterium]|nr:Zn-dependent hydrolase [Hyphomicrobiaceae bacterium]
MVSVHAHLDPSLLIEPASSRADHQRLARDLFDALRRLSFDGVGISRETYGPGETQAMELIERVAKAHGLTTSWDGARNLVVRLEGREPALPVVATGSHIDSVPQGGNFDGAAGVIASLLGLLAVREFGPPRRSVELYVLRGEESAWFGGPCYFGSRALFGQLTPADLASAHRTSGRTLGEHMRAAGVEMAPIEAATPLTPPSRFACWLELHIEQGPVLVARDKPLGLVTGIRGNVRHRRVVCRGEAAHSGAVPRWLRHDAVLAMAELLVRLDEHWRVLLEWGEDLVLTSGIVETNPGEHAVSRVPGEVSFALEYRSQDAKTLKSFGALIESECTQVARKRGVTFELGAPVTTEPARMSEPVRAILEAEAAASGVAYEIMPSGAGHDSAVFANAGVPAAMLFVRNERGSHNPHESMELDDFFAAAEVLARGLRRLAEQREELRS